MSTYTVRYKESENAPAKSVDMKAKSRYDVIKGMIRKNPECVLMGIEKG